MSETGEKSHEPEQHRRSQRLVKAFISWSVCARFDFLAIVVRSLLGSTVRVLPSGCRCHARNKPTSSTRPCGMFVVGQMWNLAICHWFDDMSLKVKGESLRSSHQRRWKRKGIYLLEKGKNAFIVTILWCVVLRAVHIWCVTLQNEI